MDKLYEKFYRGLYLKTGGFFSSIPINQNVYPGDFFQIRNGEIVVLGNIFRKSIVDADVTELEYDIKLNPAHWTLLDGVTEPYSGRGKPDIPMKGDVEFSKLILAFEDKGSYLFKGEDPIAVKIKNWSYISQELIIKLTQTLYSFREIYVVTQCASMDKWTLAISSSNGAELEIAANSANIGLADIFGHPSSKTIQSREIEYFHRQNTRKPTFFKAKKLVIQNEKQEMFHNQLNKERLNRGEWATNFFECDFDTESKNFSYNVSNNNHVELLDLLDLLPTHELNPNTALLYFRWEDANLDDIKKLFSVYGS